VKLYKLYLFIVYVVSRGKEKFLRFKQLIQTILYVTLVTVMMKGYDMQL